MIYVKSFLFGIGGGILAAVVWVLVSFVMPIFGAMLIGRLLNRTGGGGAAIGSGSILLAALAGFVIATWWALRHYRAI